jgi:hypothetical protein
MVSAFQRTAQIGSVMAITLHSACLKVRRTSRTDQDRAPTSRAIIGATAVRMPMPKIASGK